MSGPGETTIVVSTYDEARWVDLVACLKSLATQTAPPLETIVVVDHNPRLLERVHSSFPFVRAVPNQRRRGLAGARNAGIELARGSLIAFVDDDAQAEPEWLQRLVSCFEDAATVGAGGALVPLWRSREPAWLPPELYWTIGCSYTGLPAERGPIRNPIGANMAVRAGVLRKAGGFHEGGDDDAPREIRSRGVVRAAGNVPDDTELAIRVSQQRPGAVWLYEPRAVVRHSVNPERAGVGYFLRRCFEEGAGKANLARRVGTGDGLRSERRHLASVLPRGFARGLRETAGGDPNGLLRSLAIGIGVLFSTAGFVAASAGGSLERPPARR